MQVKTMDTISQYNMGEYCIHVRLSNHTVKCTPHIIIISLCKSLPHDMIHSHNEIVLVNPRQVKFIPTIWSIACQGIMCILH